MYLNTGDKWNVIKQHVSQGIVSLFPISTSKGHIELLNLDIKEPANSISDQRDTLIKGGSLTANVYGTFRMTDAHGKVTDSAKIKILDLPAITHRGTFVVQGKDYSVFNQMRLRPGVYTRKSEDSGDVTTTFNLGKGLGFKILLSPNDGVFYARFDKSKASTSSPRIPLYSLLKIMGQDDGTIKAHWGERVYANNVSKSHILEDAHKLVQLAVYEGKRTGHDVADLKAYFEGTELNADTTKITLGHGYAKVEAGALLAAADKMVRVYSDKENEDDMDSLLFKEILSVEDHLMLRIQKGIKDTGLIMKIKRGINEGKDLRTCIPTNMLSKLIETFYTKSSLAAPQTEINPVEILETNNKITAMGEGGIRSEHGIPMSARNLHPSHFGFLDPVRTTESTRVGVDLRTTHGSEVRDRNIYATFLDKTGHRVQLRPIDMSGKIVGFAGQQGKKNVRVLVDGEMKDVPADHVDYWMDNSKDMFTHTSNLVPFLHNDQGNRITMASRMITQSVPLIHREAPHVQVKDGATSLEQHMGTEYFSPKAPEAGTVTEINEGFIRVNDKKVDIYTSFPLNYKSVSGKSTVNVLKVTGELWRGNIEGYRFERGDKVQSIDPDTKLSAWLNINGYLQHKNDKKLYTVRYKSGRSVTVTEDHSLITLGSNGEMVPAFAKDCTVGTTKSPIAMLVDEAQDQSSKFDSYEYGVISGLYLSEGSCYIQKRGYFVEIACAPNDRAEEICELATKLGYNPHHTPNKVVRIVNKGLYDFLVSNFSKLAADKRIASSIFSYSTEFKKGLVHGYFAGDGNICSKGSAIEVSAATVSKRLHTDMIDMLSMLGVTTTKSIKTWNEEHSWKRLYLLNVIVESIARFRKFSFYKDKQQRIDTFLDNHYIKNSSMSMIQVPKEARTLILKGFDKAPGAVKNSIYERNVVSKRELVENTSVFGSWGRSDVMWDTITSIYEAPYEEYVYDFEVDKSNVFAVNNGLVVHNTYIHMTPLVKVGDRVHMGQVLAESNYTKDGTLAIGTNLKVAYIPYKGYTHEDAVVISKSTAVKLTSQHMYVKEVEVNDDITVDKNRYIKNFPSKITPDQMKKLDNEGVALKGVTVEKGDYVITALAKKNLTKYDMMLKKIQGALANPYKDSSEIWDHDRPGLVTDVIRNGSLIKVILTTEDETRVGDKLAPRHGNKCTVGLILEDHEMPHTADGKPVDIMLNPASVISRVNPGQLYETMAGKLAQHRGTPYLAENFSSEDSSKKVLRELKEAGLKAEEPLFDPKTGKKLGDVFIGSQYTMKLHKQTEGNFAARSTKAYDVNLQPSRGGEQGAKAIGLQDVYALLGHNARANLHEMGAYKSQDNAEFWNAVKVGLPPPVAREPFAFEKFKSLVGAAGIKVVNHNDAYVISPVNDAHVLAQSGGEVTSGALLVSTMDKYKAEPGGLFDEKITGGEKGKYWSHIKLNEPVINPLFEGVVKVLLEGKDVSTMRAADVKAELAKINVDKRIPEIRDLMAISKGTARDKLLKELKYLTALKKLGMKPEDYVLNHFPIIPPQFRPIYPSQSGSAPMISDINLLYKDMINVNKELEKVKDFPETDPTKIKLRQTLQLAAGAIIGVNKPVNKKNEKQEIQGLLPLLTGSKLEGGGTSKESFFHRKLMKRNQDMTGRGTILPDPDLHVDNVKIPIDMAHQLYKPFIINNLVRKGFSVPNAMTEAQDRSHAAVMALNQEMENRPVILNRAPTLHKYNIMAFKPLTVEGKSIFIPPLVIKGFAADFDGDSVHGDTWVVVKDENGDVHLKQIRDVE